MRRIHPHEGGAELLGKTRLVLGLEKPREHRLEFAANALATPSGTSALSALPGPDRYQHEDKRRRDGDNAQRQPQRSNEHQEHRSSRHQSTGRQSRIMPGCCRPGAGRRSGTPKPDRGVQQARSAAVFTPLYAGDTVPCPGAPRFPCGGGEEDRTHQGRERRWTPWVRSPALAYSDADRVPDVQWRFARAQRRSRDQSGEDRVVCAAQWGGVGSEGVWLSAGLAAGVGGWDGAARAAWPARAAWVPGRSGCGGPAGFAGGGGGSGLAGQRGGSGCAGLSRRAGFSGRRPGISGGTGRPGGSGPAGCGRCAGVAGSDRWYVERHACW